MSLTNKVLIAFHAKASQLHRITQEVLRNGEEQGTDVFTGYGLGIAAREEIPEVRDIVRYHPHYDEAAVVRNPSQNIPFKEEGLVFTDRNFFEVFDFEFMAGDRASVLNEKHSAVITESMALKYFDSSDAIGKTLEVSGEWASGSYLVTGVLKSFPPNSHLQFDFALPMQTLLESQTYQEDDGWGWSNFLTYILLDEGANLDSVNSKFDRLLIAHQGDDLTKSGVEVKTQLQPLTDIHLKSDFNGDPITNHGSIQYVRIFTLIGVFIIIMAWVNYINLATAHSMYRAKEVAIRKSIGAVRMQLMRQFLTESLMVNFVSALLSVGVVFLILPLVNKIIGQEMSFELIETLSFWGWYIGVIVTGSLLSGLYPAFILSSFKPITAFGAHKVTKRNPFNLRKGLIVFQFLISLLLTSGTYLVYNQISFMKSKDLGIEMEKILVVHGPKVGVTGENFKSKMQTFKNQVTVHHSITGVASSGMVPAKGYNLQTELRRVEEGNKTYHLSFINFVDLDFIKTYDLELIAGESFIKDVATIEAGFVINEEGLHTFKLGTPNEAVGKKLQLVDGTYQFPIIGVVRDFGWHSVKEAQAPYIFALGTESRAYFSIKMDLNNLQESISHIETSYNEVFPDNPFDYFFLDQEFNRQYQSEVLFGNLFFIFTVLAIFIACLGLFALVSYSTILRIKEIGIRKVLGASIGQLVILLTKEYSILLAVAMFVAFPIVYYAGQFWLNNYAWRVAINSELFLFPGLILAFISSVTVIYRILVAVRANPVHALRNE